METKTKKELKEEYKQKKFRIGVYQIRNTVNGKIFIGSNVNLDAIWNRHQIALETGRHQNSNLQAEWNSFGEDKFKYEILAEVEQKENENIDYAKEAKQLEELYIEELQPFGEKGYHVKK